MSEGTQFVIYLVAFIAFVVAAVYAWVVQPRAVWATFVAVGLALWTLIAFWNALAAS
jgi:hypothetical protein